MTEILEKRGYRDPMEVLIVIEGRTCAGCRHEDKDSNWDVVYCALGNEYGHKCKSYAEVDNGQS